MFFRRKKQNVIPLGADMHSHLLYGLDDGAQTLDDSLRLISQLQEMGYTKLITTPHIMGDFFKNSSLTILPKLEELNNVLQQKNAGIQISAAAEYYLDEWFMEKLIANDKMLTFGKNYLLFETSYINSSSFLDEAIFTMKSLGYIPVMAHPERYLYLHSTFSAFEKIREKGVLFQVNINSLSGYYNEGSKRVAEKLIDQKMVDFAGTDCHATKHIEALKRSIKSAYYTKLLDLPLLNREL